MPKTKTKVRERHVVVISREWDNPSIQVSVTDVRIAVAMTLDGFIQALASELEADPELRTRLTKAADVVCTKMKRETTKVM